MVCYHLNNSGNTLTACQWRQFYEYISGSTHTGTQTDTSRHTSLRQNRKAKTSVHAKTDAPMRKSAKFCARGYSACLIAPKPRHMGTCRQGAKAPSQAGRPAGATGVPCHARQGAWGGQSQSAAGAGHGAWRMGARPPSQHFTQNPLR